MRWASNMSDKRMQISLTIAENRPRKSTTTEWRFLSHSQPSLSLCLSLQLGISSSWCPPCLPCRKIVLSEFSVTTQTNLEAAGGQCSAVRLPGCYQGVPDTSTAPDLGLGAAILCLRLTLRQKAETQHQCFHQVSSTKYYFSHYYTVVGGGESQDFLTF